MKRNILLGFLWIVLLSACGEKDTVDVSVWSEENVYPYEYSFSGYCFHDHLYGGDTTVKFDGLDTIKFVVTSEHIQLSGDSYRYEFINDGDELKASDGGYISAAGGFWGTGFEIKKDSIFISRRSGNSFRDRYNFKGEKL